MSNSDQWINRLAMVMLGIDADEAADVTRLILDVGRGEDLRISVHWNNLGAKEAFDLLPTTSGVYKLVEIEAEDA